MTLLSRSLLPFLLALAACDDGGDAAAPAPSRVVAVQAEESTRTPEAFCDLLPEADDAPTFAMPELAESIDVASDQWRWINVWATWCAPCVEEIPTLVDWEQRLARDGAAVDLVLLSVDSTAEVVRDFRARVPNVPESARMADPNGVDEWMRTLGMDQPPSLPIQILVDPAGRTRCIRAGAVAEEDYAAIERLVAG